VASELPKVKKVGSPGRGPVYALIAVVALLLLVVVVLLFGGGLFDEEPTTDLERDYQQLTQALREDPENPALLMTLAEVEFLMGKQADALDRAGQAAEIATETAGIPMRYAQLLVQVERYDEALTWIDREIELLDEQKSAEAKFVKAQVLWALGEQDEAIELLGRALEIGYMAADMRIIYANWLAEVGRTEEAIEQYREALRFLPGDERAIRGSRRSARPTMSRTPSKTRTALHRQKTPSNRTRRQEAIRT
jgi:tetratricopeptide (TPR) repeat protein